MAGTSLTAAQQTALEQFETDSQVARDSATADDEAQQAWLVASAKADETSATALEAHGKALDSAQAFVDAMLAKEQTPTPAPAGAQTAGPRTAAPQ